MLVQSPTHPHPQIDLCTSVQGQPRAAAVDGEGRFGFGGDVSARGTLRPSEVAAAQSPRAGPSSGRGRVYAAPERGLYRDRGLRAGQAVAESARP